MTQSRNQPAFAFFFAILVFLVLSFSFSQQVSAAGSQTYTTPGTYTFTVPAYGTLTVTVNGAGGGGGGNGYSGSNFYCNARSGASGSSGGNTQFDALIAYGGSGGAGEYLHGHMNPGRTCLRSYLKGSAGAPGGTNGLGDTNTTGGGSAGGSGASQGGHGGAGGGSTKTYTAGQLAVGSDVSVTVGTGGSGGATGGGRGTDGSVTITWTDPPITAPTCTLLPSSQTVVSGDPATLDYTIFGSATSAAINGVSVPISASGTYSPSPVSDTSYTMTVSNDGGSNSCGPASVTVTSPTTPITGYAWSDTIGWISLSGTGYGLAIAKNGDLSGYAWSDNIGWVSANASDLTGCPSGTCEAKLSGGNLQGWLKALSANGDGWDGWISLNGSGYGPTVSNGNFSGYAWGSDVVGWVDFSLAHTSYTLCSAHYYCAANDLYKEDAQCNDTFVQTCSYQCAAGACLAPPPPAYNSGTSDTGIALTGHLQVAPSLLSSGSTTHVYWDISNVSSCSVTGSNGDSWSGASSGTSGKLSAAITQQTIYTLSCTGVDGSHVSESATVNILPVFKEL